VRGGEGERLEGRGRRKVNRRSGSEGRGRGRIRGKQKKKG